MSKEFHMVKVYTDGVPVVAEFHKYKAAATAFNSFVFHNEHEVELIRCSVLQEHKPKPNPRLKKNLDDSMAPVSREEEFKREYEGEFVTPESTPCEHRFGNYMFRGELLEINTADKVEELCRNKWKSVRLYSTCPDCGEDLVKFMIEHYRFKDVKFVQEHYRVKGVKDDKDK